MLSAISSAKEKLKKTETKQFFGVNSPDEISSEDWFAANIENWYEQIKDFTFKTTIIDMTREQGLLLHRVYKSQKNNTELSHEDKESFQKLEDSLEVEISKFPNGSFVKLSCRSPKDATALAPEMIERYRSVLKKRAQEGKIIDDNAKLIELFTSHIQILCSKNAKEALRWFIKSVRVYQDIELALKEENFPVQVSILKQK